MDRVSWVLPNVISIHAPAKGATVNVLAIVKQYDISIHAPAKGATSHGQLSNIEQIFQSTHPRRVRPR